MTIAPAHILFKELVAMGVPENQAELLSTSIHSNDTNKFATKEQVQVLEVDIKTDIAVIKTDLANIKSNMTLNMATKSDLAKIKTDIILSMVGLIVSSIGVSTGLIIHFLGK